MRRLDYRILKELRLLILAFSSLLSACQSNSDNKSTHTMTELSPRLKSVFEEKRTVCFGRFVMQIPATAIIVYGPTEVDTPIEYIPQHAEKISEHLISRAAEIEKERRFLMKHDFARLPLFGKILDGARQGQKIIFGSKDQTGYTVHSFLPINNNLFIQYVDSISPDEDILKVFNTVANGLRERHENEIPAESGVCIERGFISSTQEREWVRIGIKLKEFPDIQLSISAHKNLSRLRKDNSPLLLREQAKEMAENNALGAVFSRTKVIRQQARKLGNWEGEEIALRTPAYKDEKSVHEFRFHSMGEINNPLLPELDIRLDTGIKENNKARLDPSLTDEETLTLWDKLITTIRVRQPSDATPVKNGSSRIPLAIQCRTGETCPQTGWWECTESGKIKGSQRSLIQIGKPMPFALVASRFGLWQKLTGQHPIQQAPTVWKLVAYEDDLVTTPTVG